MNTNTAINGSPAPTACRNYVRPFLLLAAIGACASALMFWITAYGPAVSPDSTVYILTAKSLLAGHGFYVYSTPMTLFGPAYPILLAMAGFFQPDVLQAGRLLHALLFGVNLVLVGLAAQLCTRRNVMATACALLAFVCSSRVVLVYSTAWSEPPFITFALAGFVLLSMHIAHPRLYLLLSGSIALGLAVATRYVGITLLPPVIFALLVFGHRSTRHRIMDSIIATLLTCLPVSIWLIRNILNAKTVTGPGRGFAVHPFDLDHVKSLIHALYSFVLPVSAPYHAGSIWYEGTGGFILPTNPPWWIKASLLAGLTALLFAVLAMLHKRNYLRRNLDSVCMVFPLLCVLYFVANVVFHIVFTSFFDADLSIDARHLLPVALFLVLGVISLVWSLSQALEKRAIWHSFVLLALLFISINAVRTASTAIYMHRNGRGFTSRDWRNSETISRLTAAQDIGTIYSNGPDVIRFLTGRDSILIPRKIKQYTRRLNEDYERQRERMCRECGEGKAVLVDLYAIEWRPYLPSLQELESKCNMPVLRKCSDGVIYGTRLGAEAERAVALDGGSAALHPHP